MVFFSSNNFHHLLHIFSISSFSIHCFTLYLCQGSTFCVSLVFFFVGVSWECLLLTSFQMAVAMEGNEEEIFFLLYAFHFSPFIFITFFLNFFFSFASSYDDVDDDDMENCVVGSEICVYMLLSCVIFAKKKINSFPFSCEFMCGNGILGNWISFPFHLLWWFFFFIFPSILNFFLSYAYIFLCETISFFKSTHKYEFPCYFWGFQ